MYIERRGISFGLFYRRSVKQRVRDRSIEQDRAEGKLSTAVATTRKILSPASVLSFLYPASKPTDCFHRPISSLKGGESECIEAKGMRIGQRAIIFLGSVSKLKSLSRLLLVENSIPFLADRPSLITFLLRVCYFIDNNDDDDDDEEMYTKGKISRKGRNKSFSR